jgi:dihydrofolate reductase
MEIVLVAAVAKNNVIGYQEDMPWRKEKEMKNARGADMEHFKELTTGHPVIMGRVTYESIPKKFRPLPGRLNVVLTSQDKYEDEDVLVAHSLEEALECLKAKGRPGEYDYSALFSAGGGKVYEAMLPIANRIELTYFNKEYEGDTFFPEFSHSEWERIKKEDHRDEEFGIDYSFITLVRKQ